MLEGGRRSLNRDTESGQLLVDLARHADVIEYLAWINSFSEKVKGCGLPVPRAMAVMVVMAVMASEGIFRVARDSARCLCLALNRLHDWSSKAGMIAPQPRA